MKSSGELMIAFEKNDLDKIFRLTKNLPASSKRSLRSVIEVYKQQRKYGMTPIISAILHRNEPICELLVDDGVDLNQNKEKYLLAPESTSDILEMASCQVSHGPDSNIFKDYMKTTPMFWAITCNLPAIVYKLLTVGHKIDLYVEKTTQITALLLAVLFNSAEVVHLLLNRKADLHTTLHVLPESGYNCRALDCAIMCEHTGIVEILIKNGENLNCELHEDSPLILAIKHTSIRMVSFLIDQGANIQLGMLGRRLALPLVFATELGFFDIVKLLIKKGANVKAKTEHFAFTALHVLAVVQGKEESLECLKLEIAKLLIEEGADVNAENIFEETALFEAVSCGNHHLVKYLLGVGAKVNIKNKNGESPLLAAIIASVDVTRKTQIRSHREGGLMVNTPCTVANQCEVVITLIEAGADIDSRDKHGNTPLYIAVINNNPEIAKVLLKHGANMNITGSSNIPLLIHAVKLNNLRMILCLLTQRGVNVDTCDSEGRTCLHFAVDRGINDITLHLVRAGANPNIKDASNSSPFSIAVCKQRYELCKLLIKAKGVDINQRYDNGRSVLHMAAQLCDLKFARLLLEEGADVNIKDVNNMTPLNVGIIRFDFNVDLVKLFLEYGAEANEVNELTKLTTYQCAGIRHSPKLLKLFWQHGCPFDETKVEINLKKYKWKLYRIFTTAVSSKHIFTLKTSMNKEEKLLRSAEKNLFDGIINNKEEKVLSALLKGAEPRSCSKALPYPLHYLVKNGFHTIIKLLLNNGAPPNRRDENLKSPFEVAVVEGDADSCKLLLQHGACYDYVWFAFFQRQFFHNSCVKEILKMKSEVVGKNDERLQQLENQIIKIRLGQAQTGAMQSSQHTSKVQQPLAYSGKKAHKLLKQRHKVIKELNYLGIPRSVGPQLTWKYYYVGRLLCLVDNCFWCVKHGNPQVLELLEEHVNNKDWESYLTLVNCVNRKGQTLMATAVQQGHKDIVEKLIMLRLSLPDLE